MDLQKLGQASSREELESMPKSALVELVLEQGKIIAQLVEEVERLKRLLDKDSSDSSKPPSTDIIKRSEKPPTSPPETETSKKRKPGGQPGHKGKTRKGFGRVDRYQTVEACSCPVCGGEEFEAGGRSTRTYTIAQLVERPIEIVAYQQVRKICTACGSVAAGVLPDEVIPGQDLSASLQGRLPSLGSTKMLGSSPTTFPAGVETQISPSTGVRRGLSRLD